MWNSKNAGRLGALAWCLCMLIIMIAAVADSRSPATDSLDLDLRRTIDKSAMVACWRTRSGLVCMPCDETPELLRLCGEGPELGLQRAGR